MAQRHIKHIVVIGAGAAGLMAARELARAGKQVMIVGALVGVLKSAPSTHVVDEDAREVRMAKKYIADELFQRWAAIEVQAAAALIGIGTDNRKVMLDGICRDGVGSSIC